MSPSAEDVAHEWEMQAYEPGGIIPTYMNHPARQSLIKAMVAFGDAQKRKHKELLEELRRALLAMRDDFADTSERRHKESRESIGAHGHYVKGIAIGTGGAVEELDRNPGNYQVR